MSFPLSASKVLGYDPGQVDALMIRVGRQVGSPASQLVTSSMLEVARFERVLGGYQVRAVDEALAKVSDNLQIVEVTLEIGSLGLASSRIILEDSLEKIRAVLEQGPKKAFAKSNRAYSPKKTSELLGRISVKRGVLTAPDGFELRTFPLGKVSSGPSVDEVDEFLGLVIRAQLFQRLLAG